MYSTVPTDGKVHLHCEFVPSTITHLARPFSRQRIRIHGLHAHRSLLSLHRLCHPIPNVSATLDEGSQELLSQTRSRLLDDQQQDLDQKDRGTTRASSRSHHLPQRTSWPRLSTTSVMGNPVKDESSPADISSADAHVVHRLMRPQTYGGDTGVVVNDNGFAQSTMVHGSLSGDIFGRTEGDAGA